MSQVRILYVNPTAQLGGAEYSLLDLAASLDRQRFRPTIACLGDGPLVGAAAERGIDVRRLELPDRVARLSLKGIRSGFAGLAVAAASSAPLVRELRALARAADIVHTNGNKAHLLGSASAGRAALVWHIRDFWKRGALERGLVRIANLKAGAVIANSSAVHAHLLSMGLSGGIAHAVPNGIDSNRFAPAGPVAAVREEFRWEPRAPVIGIVGMLARWKGQDVLLQAFQQVLRQRPDARCVIVGDEIYVTAGQSGFRDELKGLAQRLGIGHAVAFAGYRTDPAALMRAMNVVVHASVEPEPFGRVVAEGMACERAVIATDAGGAPEVTGPSGGAALLVPPRDVAALASAITRLIDNPLEARRLGVEGRRRVVSLFPVKMHVSRVQALYEQVLAGSKLRRRAAVSTSKQVAGQSARTERS
jgi:glycosyltransferase involved in cell wall biosynthesis